MTTSRFSAAMLCLLLAAGAAWAEETPAMPEPTEGHKALEMFVGHWMGQGQMAPGPYGPGGPAQWKEECSWFGDTQFHVVCHSKGEGPIGPIRGLGIMGYDAANDVYKHYGIDSTGWMGDSKGRREGDTWTFEGQEVLEGKTYYNRYSVTMESPSKVSFSWSMSEDGESWAEMMTGSSEKQ